MFRTALPVVACASVLLAGCTQTTDALRSLNWANFAYPTSCFAASSARQLVHVHNREAVNHYGDRFFARTPVYGQLATSSGSAGHARAAAAVVLGCVRATGAPDEVAVYVNNHGPSLVGFALTDTDDQHVDHVTFSHGDLVVVARGYSAGAPQCCPDVWVTSHWRLSGTTLARVDVQRRSSLDGSPSAS